MISQGAAAETALRTSQEGGRRRKWSRDLWALRVVTQSKVKSKRPLQSFKERWTSFKICLDLCPLGTKKSLSNQSLAEYQFLNFEEGTREEHHKKKKTQRGKVQRVPKHTNGPQAKQTKLGWLIFFFFFFAFCSVALPAGVYRAKSQTSAKSNKNNLFPP